MLDERQLKNLLLFLDRVECKGVEEASALVELVSVLTKMVTGETRTLHEETTVPEKGAYNGTD